MADLLSRLCNSHARLKREREEMSDDLLRRCQLAEEEEARNRRPKYEPYNGVKCFDPTCKSNVPNAPPEFKARFVQGRGGYMVCEQCGTEQPGSRIMVQAEERRNFEDTPDHRRTERVREGETGGTSYPAALGGAGRIAETAASGKNGVDEAKEREIKDREHRYKKSVRELADTIEHLSSVVRENAVARACDLACAVIDHRSRCGVKGCRLGKMPQSNSLIAAALIREAGLFYKVNTSINSLAWTYLPRVDREYKPTAVSNVCDKVRRLIDGYEQCGTYSCMAANVQAPTGAPDDGLLKYTQPIQQICEELELSYPTQLSAEKNVTDWFNKGLGGNTPPVVAGAAVWSVIQNEGGQIEAVAGSAGCAAQTITRLLAELA